MQKLLYTYLLLFISLFTLAQKSLEDTVAKAALKVDMHPNFKRELSLEAKTENKGEINIKGQKVSYKVITGTMPVWDDQGKAIAGLFYVYYERTDVSNKTERPLVISFNGGPGTASVWMHLGYTGPRKLKIDDEGYPIQPYGFDENPQSILDVADIVYIDPVNTGFSRILDKSVPTSKFFGVNADIKYLAEWINAFVARQKRWASPKFLIGESYGTARVAGLSLELQNKHWMYLNGVILVSPTDLGIERGGNMSAAMRVPYMAATAWYHKKLPVDLQSKDLTAYLPEVEEFTLSELLPAIAQGGALNKEKRALMVKKLARYTGLSEIAVMNQNLEIPLDFFWKELLRNQGKTVGRLDSRYIGIDKKDAGDKPDYNSELTSWEHSFTPAINMYLRDELGYKTDLPYYIFGPTFPWDRTNNHTGDDLRQAMMQNPYLHVLVQSGYYDGACDYFNAKYNMWQMDPAGKIQDRMFWEGYRSGHMMYLRKEDLKTSNDHLRTFIKKSIPKHGTPAKF
ncbi:S10 family peptidase [Aquirufa ecclesiirivi]|uniref:S10 family peptidase n=1 Tax=Aquirufa ecclesiirivi TaxID=2715124 RepID=UPI00140AEA62|nr:carboxypeptidase [Aquirufa ecclesiirivi]